MLKRDVKLTNNSTNCNGGLGIRRVTSLALPAFVASALSTFSLQAGILADCAALDSNFLHLYLTRWSTQFGDVPDVLPTKQPFWDRPEVLADKALVETSLNSPYSRASFLADCHQHSRDWRFALPIASCGLKLDNKAVRVSVGLRLGVDLCVPHECHCGSRVDAYGVHSFVCKSAPGKTSRHHAFNNLISCGFPSAGFSVTKEPSGLFRSDGRAESVMLGRHSNMSIG